VAVPCVRDSGGWGGVRSPDDGGSGQAEARWEALPARFDWAVKAAEDRAAEGEAEMGTVGEEAQGAEQTVREDGAVEGVWEVGMSLWWPRGRNDVRDRVG
jgi:hypothetical protein